MKSKLLQSLIFFTAFSLHFAAFGQIQDNQLKNLLGTDQVFNLPSLTENEEKSPNSILKQSNFPCDCKTDFYTVDANGAIQMWSVVNNTVVGGDTILTDGDRGGLALCGPDPNSQTFFCANAVNNTFMYYNTNNSDWTYVTIPFNYLGNNGGFREHQYYMKGLEEIYYYDGFNFSLVPGQSDRIKVADIAVDTLGQAWIFTGTTIDPIATELRVYNSSGLVASYPININTNYFYGSFFMNNMLYIARGFTEDIVPVTISGGAVTFGTPISLPPFPPNFFMADAAGCPCSNEPPACSDLSPVLTIVPGNISGASSVNAVVRVSELNNADTDPSQSILVRMPSDSRYTFAWDPTLTSVGFTSVQNAQWSYNGSNPLFHSWLYTGSNSLPGGTASSFGFNGVYDPQSTNGSTTVTVTVIPFSGGECTITNNGDAETLIYFD